jgi:hypothetical protein
MHRSILSQVWCGLEIILQLSVFIIASEAKLQGPVRMSTSSVKPMHGVKTFACWCVQISGCVSDVCGAWPAGGIQQAQTLAAAGLLPLAARVTRVPSPPPPSPPPPSPPVVQLPAAAALQPPAAAALQPPSPFLFASEACFKQQQSQCLQRLCRTGLPETQCISSVYTQAKCARLACFCVKRRLPPSP